MLPREGFRGFSQAVGLADALANGCELGLQGMTGKQFPVPGEHSLLKYPGAIFFWPGHGVAVHKDVHSVFIMHHKYGISIPDMVNRVSLNPAKATHIDKEFGSLEVGKRADVLIVDEFDGYPVITHVLVDGKTTSRVEYRK